MCLVTSGAKYLPRLGLAPNQTIYISAYHGLSGPMNLSLCRVYLSICSRFNYIHYIHSFKFTGICHVTLNCYSAILLYISCYIISYHISYQITSLHHYITYYVCAVAGIANR